MRNQVSINCCCVIFYIHVVNLQGLLIFNWFVGNIFAFINKEQVQILVED